MLSFQMEYINDTYANHMLIRLGYDIALRLAFPTAVIYVLHVHPARKGDLVKPEDFRTSQNCLSRNISMDSATIVDASTAQQASFAFSTTQSFAILAHSIPTHPTRLNTTFANCRWKPYLFSCRAVTVKSTASCLTSPGKPSAPLPLDGHGYRRFATSSMAISALIT